MKYLIDSDVIVDQLRGKIKLDQRFKQEGSTISVITYGELMYGALRSNNPHKSGQALDDLLTEYNIKVSQVTQKIIKQYAITKRELELKGMKLDEFDIIIAVTAEVYDLILITRNIQHFKRIEGLKLGIQQNS